MLKRMIIRPVCTVCLAFGGIFPRAAIQTHETGKCFAAQAAYKGTRRTLWVGASDADNGG
jgi:hypothetical protein